MKQNLFQLLISFGIIVFCSCQNKKQYAEAILSNITEKDKPYQDISSDTLIFQSFDYFKENNDIERSALIAFGSGQVYHSQKNYKKDLESYLETQTYAKKMNNKFITYSCFFGGDINYEQMLFPEALIKLLQTQQLTHLYSDNYKREIVINNTIGNCYLMEEKMDSSLFYYNRALDLTRLYKDLKPQSIIKANLNVIYRKQRNFNLAKKDLQKTIAWNKDRRIKLYLNPAKCFCEEERYDSAVYYTSFVLDLIKKEKNTFVQSNLYLFLLKMEKQKRNYRTALKYHYQYANLFFAVLNEKRIQNLLIIESNCNYEQTRNKNSQCLIESQSIYLLLLISFITIIVICFFSYRKITSQKNHILKMEIAYLEIKRQIQSLQNMAKNFNEKEKNLRNEVFFLFEIMKKVALLKNDKQFLDKSYYKHTPLEKINNIVYKNKNGLDWDYFLGSINALHTGIIEKINQTYPSLDQRERKICYLICMDFNNPEMATLLELALNTIEQKKTNIRKKLGIPDRGKIKEFIIQNLSFSNF
jgi:DNA-binding CsgD family transcriptional regulator